MNAKVSYVIERLSREFSKTEDDAERSKEVLKFYIESVVKFDLPDSAQCEYEITDGPSDGGLDAYLLDRVSKTVYLFQCKWISGNGKLSLKDSLDLYTFYNSYLLPGESTRLSDPVKAFISRFQMHYKDWNIKLVYLSTKDLDPTAIKEYNKLDKSFALVNLELLSSNYVKVLSEEEEVKNDMIFSLPREYISFETEYPETEGHVTKVRVLQSAIRGIDLKRAWDALGSGILNRNLRFGIGGKINQEMEETAKGKENTAFFILHNGISIVCSNFHVLSLKSEKIVNHVPEDDQIYVQECMNDGIQNFVRLKDFQIVNGGQTTITLAELKEEPLKKVLVPCKISETSKPQIAARIAVCNNTQNRITPWDLVANSEGLMLLQNYAAKLDPSIFFQRKRGEKWSQVLFLTGSKPKPERCVVANKVYQAYASFNGLPGPAYTRPGSIVSPNSPIYNSIEASRDIDAIILSGLLGNYESYCGTRSDPEFTDYWTQWAIALAGHVYKYRLTKTEQWAFKEIFLSENGITQWKKLRKHLIGLVTQFLKDCFEESAGPLKIFKNDEELWKNAKFPFKPKYIWPFLRPDIRENSFEIMRERQQEHGLIIEYCDVNFAILATYADRYFDAHPLPKF